jgi:thiosulfate/3-mercaptopyruvate sulfurtransferase
MTRYKTIVLIVLLSVINLNAKSLRVEVKTLHSHIKDYKILDTRAKKKFLFGHIPKALNFPVDLTFNNKKLNGKIMQPKRMQTIIRKLGLSVDDNIIIYDDGTFFNAARLFWTLEVYGFKNVKLLNGGYIQWKKHNFKITKNLEKIVKSNYIVSVDHKRLATKFTTQIATKTPNQIILDARPITAYNGKISVSKRYGHIPKAIHFPATHHIDYDSDIVKLKSTKDLKKLYINIDKNKKIIVYCAIGKIASTNYFSLRELDYDVANYDSSWKEWGNDFSLPIVNPSDNF